MPEDLSFLETPAEVTDDVLKELSGKIESLQGVRQELDFLEEQMKELQKRERALSMEEIPELLLSRGLSEVKLESGAKVAIKENLSANVPKNPLARNKVLRWLQEHNGEDLIKQELKVEEPELHVIEYLKTKGVVFSNELNVNTNSFKAFLREQLGMKKGSLQRIEIGDIPKEASPYVYRDTIIKS